MLLRDIVSLSSKTYFTTAQSVAEADGGIPNFCCTCTCIALDLNLLSELIRLDDAPQMTALVVKTRQNGWSLLDGAPLA